MREVTSKQMVIEELNRQKKFYCNVFTKFGMSKAEAKKYITEGHFAKGSMLPKIQAIVRFLEAGGKEAIVTNPESLERALRGETGTHIYP